MPLGNARVVRANPCSSNLELAAFMIERHCLLKRFGGAHLRSPFVLIARLIVRCSNGLFDDARGLAKTGIYFACLQQKV
jgi:hypothetical protein